MSGNYYASQRIDVLIGSKVGTTRTSTTLESTYQTESGQTKATKTVETGGFSKLNLDIVYTMGATESSNSIELILESSPDRTNWYQLPNDATSGGTSTLTQREFTFVGANATAKTIGIFVDVAYKFMRVSVKETGVASNKGTVYVEGTLSGQ